MLNLNALGYFMNYCNRNFRNPDLNITQEIFDKGMAEILNSPEGRFSHCHGEADVLKEMGIEG